LKQKLWNAVLLVGGLLALDIATKRWAERALEYGMPLDFLGVPLTLAYNTGVAFGLPLPGAGRWIIMAATLVVLVVLTGIFRRTPARDWSQLLAVQLVAAGALGNFIDRVRWSGGVVDFIGPIDLGFMQWPIFNVADMAITSGAVLLALAMLRDERAELGEPVAAPALDPADPS
jgi:signal peptidase II